MEEKKQKEGVAPQKPASERKSHARLIVLVTVLAVVILVMAGVFVWQKIGERQARMAALEAQLTEIQRKAAENPGNVTVSGNASQNAAAEATKQTVADDYPAEYKGWETYTNFEAGYKLRYPSTWKVREVSGVSQMFNKPVNYIAIESPQKKFVLHWALRNAGDNFMMDERTGIGVGENISDGHITILGNEIDVNLYSDKGAASEILYPSFGSVPIDGGQREILANFSGGPETNTDLKNVPERQIAERILRSVRLAERKSATCDPVLDPKDSEAMQDWDIFTSSLYGFSFRYPDSWELSASNGRDYVSFEDNAFQFRSEQQVAAADFGSYKEKSKMNSNIACEEGSRRFLCGEYSYDPSNSGEQCVTIAQFEKNGVPHLISYSFRTLGSSLSEIYTDNFDLIIKSLKLY